MKTNDVLALIPCYLPEDECWEYQGLLNHDGYGHATVEGHITVRAHRIMYEAHYCEPLSTGEVVRHTCDNPACCNPFHLLKGTQADNVRDCVERGRFPDRSGENNGRANVTEELVRNIRKIYNSGMWSYGLLAQLFELPKPTVAHIVKHYTWKNVT